MRQTKLIEKLLEYTGVDKAEPVSIILDRSLFVNNDESNLLKTSQNVIIGA